MALSRVKDLPLLERKIIRAWCMYDWANSGYATSGLAAFFPIYFVILFQNALGDEASLWGITFTGSSTLALALAVSTAFVALSSPLLGVVADRLPIKKTLLWVYTIGGSFFAVLAFFSAYTAHPWAWLLGTFILGNIGFAGSLVFYNSFLPHLAPRELLDDVSSRGFAYGYVGGGLLLLGHVVLVMFTAGTDYSDLIMRSAIASTGIWWFGWALWTLKVVPEPPLAQERIHLNFGSVTKLAFRELGRTLRELTRFRVIVIYLIAYFLFNDGIQTIMAVASAFAIDTLRINQIFIISALLIIQFVAAIAAMVFVWIANRTTTKRALYVALIGWILIVVLGVAIVRLVPEKHNDFDYQLNYQSSTMVYSLNAMPEEGTSHNDLLWIDEIGSLTPNQVLRVSAAESLLTSVRDSENALYTISIKGGPLADRSEIGKLHPSVLGKGAIDWWPKLVRELLWSPLGLAAEFQWLILGVCVGTVMGGSQALARSLFAQITPETRSAEFFSFFGFMNRASAVFGPLLYVIVTGMFDTRVAVASILAIIIAGTVTLAWVDVAKGAATAAEEDDRQRAAVGTSVQAGNS